MIQDAAEVMVSECKSVHQVWQGLKKERCAWVPCPVDDTAKAFSVSLTIQALQQSGSAHPDQQVLQLVGQQAFSQSALRAEEMDALRQQAAQQTWF
ncbi:MAG: hypothetical protein A3F68_07865 [Acidobacteria bacterium RIFCSPLOWO2_12_FULL_54_10]|nr:MAG: hypothetical protein A3F68_07865 [Acidobacteria bacterium RIFCSPLOWO2_12_FULL_54_10]